MPKGIRNSRAIILVILLNQKLLYLFYLLTPNISGFIIAFNIIK